MGTVLHRRLHPMSRRYTFLVSVPFSMGTVLHLEQLSQRVAAVSIVSVPFSMGTVLHLQLTHELAPDALSFSPLLDGDGVASALAAPDARSMPYMFQSPSRWGRCCIATALRDRRHVSYVSVPFSMGTVLHRRYARSASADAARFQSPSRWGRCCIRS